MKKILSLFCVLGLSIISASNVMSCGSSKKNQNNNSSMTLNKLKADFKNNNLTINHWDNFWGNLNDSLNNKTYYQLLLDQLFKQNKIDDKYEKDVVIQQKVEDNYVKAYVLNQMKDKTIESNTNLRIHIMLNGDDANISSLDVNWKLTSDQQPIYPLFNLLQKHNQLNIYDTSIKGYPNNKITIRNYEEQLQVAFNKQYPGPNNYQYTNFKTNLANQNLNTNDEANKLGLVISNRQSHYTDNNFVINFYCIINIFNSLNDIYYNKPKYHVLGAWGNRTDYDSFLNWLGLDPDYQFTQIMNYQNDLTYQGYLPATPKKGELPEVNTITISYKKEITAKVRTMFI